MLNGWYFEVSRRGVFFFGFPNKFFVMMGETMIYFLTVTWAGRKQSRRIARRWSVESSIVSRSRSFIYFAAPISGFRLSSSPSLRGQQQRQASPRLEHWSDPLPTLRPSDPPPLHHSASSLCFIVIILPFRHPAVSNFRPQTLCSPKQKKKIPTPRSSLSKLAKDPKN